MTGVQTCALPISFYGVYADRKDSIRTEAVTVYNPSSDIYSQNNESLDINIFPNPASEFIAVQVMGLNKENLNIDMYDVTGKLVQQSSISAGATNTYLDTKSLYAGTYIVKIHGANVHMTRNISVAK